MKKGLFSLLLVFAMLWGVALADVTSSDAVVPVVGAEEETQEKPAEEMLTWDYDELTVGTVNPMNGDFFTSLWGNATADIDVRMLIHGYNLVEWDSAIGGFAVDRSVVSGIAVTQDEAGNHIYNIGIYNDLYWSDGTKITAWDYAFSWMLTAWPGMKELGAIPVDRSYLLGIDRWQNGHTRTIEGIRVVADDQLALTVSAAYLPFFYELGLLDCTPVPISVVAPGCRLADDGQGIYLAQGSLDAAALRNTLLGENGYIKHPSVSSGPYMLTSYNGSEARFTLNPNYKGDSKGVVPTIPRLVLRNVDNNTMISLLASGEVGLLNKCANADTVNQGVTLVGGSEQFAMSNYTRSGFGFISYNLERPAMSSKAVRKAIAHCLDKDAAVMAMAGNYGLRVDGYYGIGQWMVELLNGTLPYPVQEPEEGADAETVAAYEKAIADWDALKMDEIPALQLDVDEAIRLLEEDGWTEKDDRGIRSKTIGGQKVALDLVLLVPEGSAIHGVADEYLIPNLTKAGIGLSITEASFEEVVEEYYRNHPRECDMIFLASNFDVMFDPSPQFQPGGARNWTASPDSQLWQLAVDMRKTEPGDALTYCTKWLAFQKRFAEEMPMLPIYSNVYFDFYPKVLQNYAVNQNVGWSKAIVGAYLGDVSEEVPEEEGEGDDGYVYFN